MGGITHSLGRKADKSSSVTGRTSLAPLRSREFRFELGVLILIF